MKPKARLSAIAAATLVAAPRAAFACAMCGLPPGDSQIHAYNTSVLFMMAVPYTIAFGGGLLLYLAYRNAMRRRRTGFSSQTPGPEAPGQR